MTNMQEGRTDVWEKYSWLWAALFYISVLVSAGLMWLDEGRAVPAWQALLLTGVYLVWHVGGLQLAGQGGAQWQSTAGRRFVVITGDIVLWFLLVSISPAYYVALFGMFGQVFHQLPIRYAVVAALLLTAAIIVEQVTSAGQPLALNDPLILLYLLIGLVCILLAAWISAIIEQSTQRRQLIEELEAAQAELVAAERRAGVLEERQRLAREIHDTLAQGFTSIVMHLEAAEQALPDDPQTLQKHLNFARDTARISLDQARRVVEDLRPDVLEQRSLPEAINRAAARWSEQNGIALTATTTGTPAPLHPDIEITLLRAAQEALSNISKHAQATDVQLTLSYMDDVVMLDVHDNGQGLQGGQPSPFAGGYGLQAMRERAELCGGSLLLESEKGEGTTLVVAIPVAE